MQYKNIIWDFDGTLFDTYPVMVDAFMKALASGGIEDDLDLVEERLRLSVGDTIHYYMTQRSVDQVLIDRYVAYEKSFFLEGVRPFEGAIDLCRAIVNHKGQNFLYTHRDSSARACMEAFGLQPYFRHMICKEDGFERKPSPQALQYLMDLYNLKAHETLMVGDRDLDIEAAINAGIRACYFKQGPSRLKRQANHVIEDLGSLYAILGLK